MTRPKKLCSEPYCPELIEMGERFCSEHEAKHQRSRDAHRGNAAARFYDRKWRSYRERFIKKHPLCCDPDGAHALVGEVVPTQEVDHIIPHRGNRKLFWDPTNHQPLCTDCHRRKTGRGE